MMMGLDSQIDSYFWFACYGIYGRSMLGRIQKRFLLLLFLLFYGGCDF